MVTHFDIFDFRPLFQCFQKIDVFENLTFGKMSIFRVLTKLVYYKK